MFDQMEAHPLRLFFGLPLPLGLRENLDQWRRNYPGIEGWSRNEGLHLTLAFLGQRPTGSLPGLAGIAAAIAHRHQDFALTTGGLGSFSRSGTTRLLWLGLVAGAVTGALIFPLLGLSALWLAVSLALVLLALAIKWPEA